MRHKRRRYQFSLRTLFVALSLPGFWIGLERMHAQRKVNAAAYFVGRGGQVGYIHQWDLLTFPSGRLSGDGNLPEPKWLRQMLGEGSYTSALNFDLSGGSVTDGDLAYVGRLPYLHALDLSGTAISDRGLVHLSALKQLNMLSLWDTKVTGQGLAVLQSCPRWKR